MNRREALRLLATGTALQLAPGNLMAALREARALVASESAVKVLTPSQRATVEALADCIIPRTETPGAKDLGAGDFVDLMLAEWYDAVDRERFLQGIADVDKRMQTLFGKTFVDANSDQRAQMMTELGERMIEEEERRTAPHPHDEDVPEHESFYPMLRRLVLTAYYTSEEGATKELHFEIIPASRELCAPATSNQGGS